MDDLIAARLQMAVSLGFHIIFASIGMAMPFLMATSHYRWLRSGSQVHERLTKAWSKGVAIFFATGAVSGTALSFELGLLWPTFMEHAGPIIGMPFSWEGTAFFIEAIALGLFLYGWGKLRPWTHWACGVLVGVSGVASAFFVIAANGWMNSPAGFDWVNGSAQNIDPMRAMFNKAFLYESIHMTIAAFMATGFAVAGVHAFLLLRTLRALRRRKSPHLIADERENEKLKRIRELHLAALRIALTWGAIFALLQPISGDLSAKDVAARQPEKFAALEGLFETQSRAPLAIGGIPSVTDKKLHYALHIPGLLSFLAHGDFNTEVKGLDAFPRDEWPPVLIVHLAFQIMVGIGVLLALVALLALFLMRYRTHLLEHQLFLKLIYLITPLGFIAIEAGWTVTEVGRQPWIIYRIMRTADAVSPMPGLMWPFILFTGLYFLLAALLIWLMTRQIRALEAEL
jgi:cytochrome d ubiquinol oxidase subunit I